MTEIRFIDQLTTDELEDIIEVMEHRIQAEMPEVTSIYVEVT